MEANVIESGERSSADVLDGVIRDQKVFLPPHKDEIRLVQRLVVEVVGVKRLGVLVKRIEFALKINEYIEAFKLETVKYQINATTDFLVLKFLDFTL